jgi:NAD dependent epimerase/dehydratase
MDQGVIGMSFQSDQQEFWQNKPVLITGAGGFIGSHLVEKLVANGAHVKAFVRYNSRGDSGMLRWVSPEVFNKLEIISGDLRDLNTLNAAMKMVDTVFHLGALIAIPYSYQHPADSIETNVMGTLNVLLAARDQEVRRIVHTSTSEVYGTAIKVPIDEDHPLQGQSPYSASKIGADKIAESFYRTYNLPVVTLRPFNTYGPRQSARAVIPTIITQALTSDSISLGNLDARRDFTYVSDTVEGFLLSAMVKGIEGRTFNLGVGEDISIAQLVEEIKTIIGKPVSINVKTERLRPDKSEVLRLISDNRLAKEHLGWVPQVNFHTGLTRTIEWISKNLSFYRPDQYQI